MRTTLKYFPRFGLAIILTVALSCEREAVLPEAHPINTNEPTAIDILRSGFSLDHFDDPVGTIKGNIEVQWENHSAKTINETLWYEFGVTQTQKADMVSRFQENNQYKLLARLGDDNKPHYFIAKLAPELFMGSQEFSYLNPERFSGTVSLYNLHGEVAFLEYYKKRPGTKYRTRHQHKRRAHNACEQQMHATRHGYGQVRYGTGLCF